ncbi:hypothetical protein MSG28_009668 [Choristoneura fumiferana]|uniref:Uncharacterized protein n=1 Tax=Choristoneura fumiferana TaxID=7141 RepID=A0ACC0JCD3_CHOFU|nr:hypothetical protein MSG28_009668 [Choristoneura fumiferana]
MDEAKKNEDGIPPIVATYRLARRTFHHKAAGDIPANINKLKTLMDGLKSEDLGLDRTLTDPATWTDPLGPPYKVIQLYDDPEVDMFILVLRPGFTLPLHDHPHMHGLLKVISGSANVVSFSKFSKQEKNDLSFAVRAKHKMACLAQGFKKRRLFAKVSQDGIQQENDQTSILTPTTSNYHKIEALDAPVAFLDVLAPPYDTHIEGIGPRICRYYKVANTLSNGVVELRETSTPVSTVNYDNVPYLGPKLF